MGIRCAGIGAGGPLVPSGYEVAGDVDAEHVGSEARRGQRGRAVAAPEIEDAKAVGDVEVLDERLTAVAHGLGDAGEVALLPERLVRVHVGPSCRGGPSVPRPGCATTLPGPFPPPCRPSQARCKHSPDGPIGRFSPAPCRVWPGVEGGRRGR